MLFGHDVEVFLTDAGTGKIIPSCGKLGGKKKSPTRVTGHFGILEDNVAVEINGQAASAQSFLDHVAHQQERLKTYLAERGFGYVCSPFALFTSEELAHPQAHTLGCDPDFDAFVQTGEPRPTPDLNSFKSHRFAGGHIHISLDMMDIPAFVYVRFLAAFLTLPVVAAGYDLQGPRRKVYGLPGLFRTTKYPDGSSGFEYRALSNFWFDQKARISPASLIQNIILVMQRFPLETQRIHGLLPWGDINKTIQGEDVATAKIIWTYLADQYSQYNFLHGHKI